MTTTLPPTPLILPGDEFVLSQPTLEGYLADWAGNDESRQALSGIVLAIANAAPAVDQRLSLGDLPGDPTHIVGRNAAGDRQKALDMAAHHHFLAALEGQALSAILSEEADDIIPCTQGAPYALAIDPIDGSDGIGIGSLLGTLFAVYPSTDDAMRSFEQTGRSVVASGYVCFGHALDFGFSLGDGVVQATCDLQRNQFFVTGTRMTLPQTTDMIAYNASNQCHWSQGVRDYVSACLAGETGPRGRDTNMRWLASAVGELHRIMRRGGVFIYPRDARSGYENGRLRLLYEAVPIAFLMEQAGGAATDGKDPILDKVPSTLHGFTPMFFGSEAEIEVIESYCREEPTL